MIDICVEDETCFIYNSDDWETLRCKHRIIGEIFGTNFCIPSLPLRLLPEEALLLKQKGFARFVSYPKLKVTPSTDEESYVRFKEDLTTKLKEVYRRIRRSQIENIIDKIVEGKRKRGDTRCREEIFEDELNKSCKVDDDSILWPIFCQDLNAGESIEVLEDEILKQTTPGRLAIFINLWDKGYYITSGSKFGGDFLLYLGDPILYHAVYIVHCVPNGRLFHPTEIVAFSRLGTSVKKRNLLAFMQNSGNVEYITLNWLDA